MLIWLLPDHLTPPARLAGFFYKNKLLTPASSGTRENKFIGGSVKAGSREF